MFISAVFELHTGIVFQAHVGFRNYKGQLYLVAALEA